jgi:hypothetical protein
LKKLSHGRKPIKASLSIPSLKDREKVKNIEDKGDE